MLRRGMRLEPVLDILHYFVLQGPRIAKDDVISYLHRATSRRPATGWTTAGCDPRS